MGGAQWANVANHGSDHTTETNTHNTGTQPTLRHSTQQTNVNRVTHKASQPWSGQLDTTPWVLERTWDEATETSTNHRKPLPQKTITNTKQKVSSSDARMTFITHCRVAMATGQSLSITLDNEFQSLPTYERIVSVDLRIYRAFLRTRGKEQGRTIMRTKEHEEQ